MLPDWNSLDSVATAAKWFTYIGWIALGSLVPLEVGAHVYSEREKTLSEAAHKRGLESLSPWALDARAEERLTDKLKPFPNTPFEVAEDSHPYAVDLTLKLVRILYGVWKPVDPGTIIPPGIQSTPPELLAPPNPFGISVWKSSSTGITVEIPPLGTKAQRVRPGTAILDDFGPPARALASALISEGIPVTVVSLKSESDAIVPMMSGSVHLIVGRKP